MQVATVASDLESYFCSHLRLMPLSNIDPSLAIGFYCRSAGESLWRSYSPVPAYLPVLQTFYSIWHGVPTDVWSLTEKEMSLESAYA